MPNLNSGAISITAIIIAATMVLLEVVDATLFRVDGLVLMPEWVKPDGFQRLELALEVKKIK
jgi:hypothetical protein